MKVKIKPYEEFKHLLKMDRERRQEKKQSGRHKKKILMPDGKGGGNDGHKRKTPY